MIQLWGSFDDDWIHYQECTWVLWLRCLLLVSWLSMSTGRRFSTCLVRWMITSRYFLTFFSPRIAGIVLVFALVVHGGGLAWPGPEDHGAGAGVSAEHDWTHWQTGDWRSSTLARDAHLETSLGHHHRALHWELGLLHPPHQPPYVPQRCSRVWSWHRRLPRIIPLHPDVAGGPDLRLPGGHHQSRGQVVHHPREEVVHLWSLSWPGVLHDSDSADHDTRHLHHIPLSCSGSGRSHLGRVRSQSSWCCSQVRCYSHGYLQHSGHHPRHHLPLADRSHCRGEDTWGVEDSVPHHCCSLCAGSSVVRSSSERRKTGIYKWECLVAVNQK